MPPIRLFPPFFRSIFSSPAPALTNLATQTATPASTVDATEVAHFQRLADTWWDTYGSMKPLHSMNSIRIPFVRDGLIKSGVVPKENIDTPFPLLGMKILDVGCGGGILSEPLAKLGAEVTGIDATEDLIQVAKSHGGSIKSLEYICTSVEEYATDNQLKYDAVVASEIIEHITNKSQFLEACVKTLKPKGSIFVTTENKTTASYFGAIIAGEHILGLLPKGTHEWEKFITPPQLQRFLEDGE